MTTVLLLICSNIFMTVAWYGNLRFPEARLGTVIVSSWGIALIEYCFAIPANRIGYAHGFSGGQLKVIQEVITLVVFAGFAAVVLKEPLGLRHLGAFACLVGAAAFMFAGRG
ncbi:MAG: DMT family protein [Sphingomonadaceae bacterium]|nr:DMT family protein [Sphingomonadaceae bacterium]